MLDTINFKIYFGGPFAASPRKFQGEWQTLEGVRAVDVKGFDRDLVSLFDLRAMVKENGSFEEGDKMYYLTPPGTSPPNRMIEIVDDKQCMELVELHMKEQWCTLYVNSAKKKQSRTASAAEEQGKTIVDEDDGEDAPGDDSEGSEDSDDGEDSLDDANYVYTGAFYSSTEDSDDYDEESPECSKGKRGNSKPMRKLTIEEGAENARFEGDSSEDELFPSQVVVQQTATHSESLQTNAEGKEIQLSQRAQRAERRRRQKECGSQGRQYKTSVQRRAKRGAGVPPNEGNEGAMSDPPSEGVITPPGSPSDGAILVSRSRGLEIVMFDPTNMRNPHIEEGMLFTSGQQFREAIRNLCIHSGRGCQMVKNDKQQISARCRDLVCTWYIYASKLPDENTFKVKKFQQQHSCGARFKCEQMNTKWLSENYQEHLRSDPKWSVGGFRSTILRDHQIEVQKSMVYRAKRKATALIQGAHTEQYRRISDYADTVLKLNPNSHVYLKLHVSLEPGVNPRFERLYFCFHAQSSGFLAGCRPFICLDGCFVKIDNGAQILGATARDGNNNIFPLAFCVAESECTDTWIWFLQKLRESIGDGNDGPWTFMSDRQKGLLHAIKEVFPDAEQRFCIRHIRANASNAGFRGDEYKRAMEKPAYAYTQADFDAAMEELKAFSPAAHAYMSRIDKKHWARHAFSTRAKTDLIVNNQGESFNSQILEARDKPIVSMMEHIRTWMMEKFAAKREGAENANWEITPSCRKKLEIQKSESRLYTPVCAGRGIWQVSGQGRTYVVGLSSMACGCYKWDLTGIPCAHAIAAINRSNLRAEDFVSPYFKKEAYVKAYDAMIFPIPDKTQWITSDKPDVDPPFFKKQPGRPKKNRRRGADELPVPSGRIRKVSTRCSNCSEYGHNYRSCPRPIRPDWKKRTPKKPGKIVRLSQPQPASTIIDQSSQVGAAGSGLYVVPVQQEPGGSSQPSSQGASTELVAASSDLHAVPVQQATGCSSQPSSQGASTMNVQVWMNNRFGTGLYHPSANPGERTKKLSVVRRKTSQP